MGQVVRESYSVLFVSEFTQVSEPAPRPIVLYYVTDLIYYTCFTALIIDDVQLATANQVLLAIGVVVLSLAIVICFCLIVGEITTNQEW